MTTVNSSAPPAPPPREALGSSKSALSGALLLGELASTLDAVSLAAAPGVSSSRAVRAASCLSRAASSHSSGDAVSGGFVRTVDVETSLSNCLDLSQMAPSLVSSKRQQIAVNINEVFDRIKLPAPEEIPDAERVAAEKLTHWRVPDTEITLVQVG